MPPKAHPRGLGASKAAWELLISLKHEAHDPTTQDASKALLARVHVTATAGRITIKVPAGTSVLVDQVSA